MKKKAVNIFLITTVIPIVIFGGLLLLRDRKYNIISIITAVIACIAFFMKYENKSVSTREAVTVATVTAITICGRFVFAAVPGFKPVTAIVTIVGIYFGSEAGFAVGALSAMLSNIYFGQGPWTPFQMFVWGFLGFAAGKIAERTKWLENKVFLAFYGIISGIAFSLMMDIWTVVSADGSFNLSRYIAAVISSFPFMATYAASNVIFLLLLKNPIGKRLERIKMKYIS